MEILLTIQLIGMLPMIRQIRNVKDKKYTALNMLKEMYLFIPYLLVPYVNIENQSGTILLIVIVMQMILMEIVTQMRLKELCYKVPKKNLIIYMSRYIILILAVWINICDYKIVG